MDTSNPAQLASITAIFSTYSNVQLLNSWRFYCCGPLANQQCAELRQAVELVMRRRFVEYCLLKFGGKLPI